MTKNDLRIQHARRATFIAAFSKKFGFSLLAASSNADAQQMFDAAEWAWNAALDSAVVELPEVEYFGDHWSGGYAIKKEDVVEAIEAADIKVKP